MPVDVVKTRLQMDGSNAVRLYKGSVDCASKLLRAEGLPALYKGLCPALLRQSTYGSLRYGLYNPIRDMLGVDPANPNAIPFWKKLAAGGGAGAIASGIANPTDLVKVRMQTDGMSAVKTYNGVLHCFTKIVRDEGVLGLWTGVGPTVGRATALAGAELATYDEARVQLKQTGISSEGLSLHVSAAFVSGFVATVASSPFDVVKSRVMGQPVDASGRGTLYSGMIDCFGKMVYNEGPLSLYKGFWPNFGRVVPRVVTVFVGMEQLKARFG